MLKSFLLKLEDPARPLLGPNFWILKKLGLVLPKSPIGKILYILLHEIGTIFVITQFIELYEGRSDLDLVLTNLKFPMLSIICVVKSNTYVIWQDRWIGVIDYITAADKEERDDADHIRSKILKGYTRYCRIITYLYVFLVFLTFLTVTSTPLMIFLSSSSFREQFRNGTQPFPHILSSWTPFDKFSSPGNWITVALHAAICFYGAAIVAAYDASAVVMMVFVGGKLDLIKERCKKILGEPKKGVTDYEAHKTIRKIHDSHKQLFNYAKKFNSLLSPVMFLYVVICSLMLCASAYQLTSAQDAAQKLLMAEFFIFGVSQLFMYCWHSTIVLYKSNNVAFGPYESAWCDGSLKQRMSLHILISQLKRTLVFSAGPFADLTLTTFIKILKGAYSYYTLLRE